VTLHSLRHSMASLLVAEGFAMTEVAGRMGHSVEMLQRTYARDLDPVAREKGGRGSDQCTIRLVTTGFAEIVMVDPSPWRTRESPSPQTGDTRR
jgi:hypothetical protein